MDGFLYSTFFWSCEYNYPVILKQLIDRHKSFPVSSNNNAAIKIAIIKNHYSIFQLILHSPSFTENEFIVLMKLTLGLKRTAMFQLLLQKKKHKLLFYDKFLLLFACKAGHLDGVKLILDSKELNPSFNDNKALFIAIADGFTDIALLIIKDYRVNPAICNGRALLLSVQKGNADVVKAILDHETIEPVFYYYMAVQLALKICEIGIYKMLIRHKKGVKMSTFID
jgi:hypothetical protein